MLNPVPLLLLAALPSALAATVPAHSHSSTRQLPSAWHHDQHHPAHALFSRGDPSPADFPPLGSPTWSSGFPQSSPDVSKLPPAWVNALDAAVTAGKIPNIPQTTNTPGTNPVYPAGHNPNSPETCSVTYKCRSPGDVWDAPNGYFLTGFDDGPLPPTNTLRRFLAQNNETTTHFMIGVNILQNPQIFQSVLDAGDDIAVHTYTHPYMTTLSNLEIVGQLGWTSQLIYNSTGGRFPKYWRPPYGDSDNRVRAIAKEVFGLTTVIWNQDTEDWSLTTNGTTLPVIQSSFQKWLSGPKSPGLMVLEHEVSEQSVQAFIAAYPVIKANGWTTGSAAKVIGGGQAYQNPPATNLTATSNTPSSAPPTTSDQVTAHSKPTSTVTGNSFGTSQTPPPKTNDSSRTNFTWTLWTLATTSFLAISYL